MFKNFTIFSSDKALKGFMIFLVLFISTEIFLYVNRPNIVTSAWNKYIVNEHKLIDAPHDYDYLIVGDSVQITGINVAIVDKDILNLGLPGAKPAGLYLLFKRYLGKHKPPKAIFLFIDPDEVHEAMWIILKYFVTFPEFISIYKDLTWNERMNFFSRYWVSMDERMVGFVKKVNYSKSNTEFVREMKAGQGYMPLPTLKHRIGDNYFATTGARNQKSIAISWRDIIYLDRLIKLASSHNVKVVILENILPKELHDIFEKTGFNKDYIIFMEALRRKYPEVLVPEKVIMYLDNKYFSDKSHLNPDGVEIYTDYFKNQVFEPVRNKLEKGD